MKKLKFLPLILLIAIVLGTFSPTAMALEDPVTQSNAIVLLETSTRLPIYTKNANTRVEPASTTKIMTALLAVEAVEAGRVSFDDVVTATHNMNFDLIPDGSSAGIQVGEEMTLQDLLYSAMLVSGNDACNVIAEYIGGTIPNFVNMMNLRAEELGCVGTNFTNTHGLPDDNHYTTATDFSLLALEATRNSLFMTIADTVQYTVPATNMSEARYYSNSNGLINQNAPSYPGYQYEGAHGVKTGYTSNAGYCLVSTAKRDDVELLCVVLGGVMYSDGVKNQFSSFTDSITLYDWGFGNFSHQNILTTADVIDSKPVSLGEGRDEIELVPQNNVVAFLPTSADLEYFEKNLVVNAESFEAPIEAGEVLGEVTVSMGGVSYGTVPLVAAYSVEQSNSSYIKAQIEDVFNNVWVKVFIALVVLFIALYVFSVVNYRKKRKAYIQKMRREQAEKERLRREASMPKGGVPRGQEPAMSASASSTQRRTNQQGTSKLPNGKDSSFEDFFKK